MTHHPAAEPSDWIQRWTHLAKAGGTVLDIACGQGRHMAWFANHGFDVTGIDRSAESVLAASQHGHVVQADIENAAWPLLQGQFPRQFDVVVVTNYLWRPLLPTIISCVAPGGLLLYETFAVGNESIGKPSRPDFLLQPAELLRVCQDMHVVAYENGFSPSPDRFIQRIAAFTPAANTGLKERPERYPLAKMAG